MPVSFLIDTGSSRTVISRETFSRIPTLVGDHSRSEEISNVDLQVADGTSVTVDLCIAVSFHIGVCCGHSG